MPEKSKRANRSRGCRHLDLGAIRDSVVWHEECLDRRLSVFLTTWLDAPFISSILANDRSHPLAGG
jgi:hypothetical protein